MDSALTPREIQTRIRAGVSLEEVAQAAGVPTERIEPYAAPVVAEREHVARTALGCPVRRQGESSSGRALRAVVSERLQQRGIDVDDVTWDAWRDPDRRWTVRASYRSGSAEHQGHFTFDLKARFSVAVDDEARWLIGESTPAHGPQPHRKRRDPDSEPTIDLNDELALVRAIQPDRAVDAPGASKTGDPATGDLATGNASAGRTSAGRTSTEAGLQGAAAPGDPESFPDPDPDYGDATLTEVNGVYDIVPAQGDMDVLYEMLSSFNEDSVNIYAGLTSPVVDDEPAPAEPGPASLEPAATPEEPAAAEEASARPALPEEALPDEDLPDEALPDEAPAVAVPDEPATAPASPAPEAFSPEASPREPRQDPLVEEAPGAVETPKPKPSRGRKRAHVPSWDEIVFGGPRSE